MRPELELLATDASDGRVTAPAFFGARWAVRLGTALLAGLALVTVARWWEAKASPPDGPEIVVQQPVPPDTFPAGSRSDTTAPDPGDNPP